MAYNVELKGMEVKKDGKNIKGSDFNIEIKEVDESKGTFWCVGSIESPDRGNDIVRVDGWNLKNYAINPMGLYCHDYYGHAYFKSLKTKKDKDEKRLLFNPQFDMNFDDARLTFNQYVNGFMNMFSVGFIPGEYKFRDEDNRWDGGIEFIKDHDLLELSCVPVPQHQGAGILRGLLNNEKSLIDLGYIPEFKLIEEKSQFWKPIDLNLGAFKDPRFISVGAGIKALSAAPFDHNFKDKIVGYLFDDKVFDESKINEWSEKNIHVVPVKKFYSLGFVKEEESENSIIVLTVSDGEKEEAIEIKEEIVPEEEVIPEKTEVIPEEAIVSNEKTKTEVTVTFPIIGERKYLVDEKGNIIVDDVQLVDKNFLVEIKTIVDGFNSLFKEFKSELESLLIKSKTVETFSDEDIFSLDSLMKDESLTPVSSNSSNKDDEKIILSDEDVVSISSTIEDSLTNGFSDIFKDEFDKLSIID